MVITFKLILKTVVWMFWINDVMKDIRFEKKCTKFYNDLINFRILFIVFRDMFYDISKQPV